MKKLLLSVLAAFVLMVQGASALPTCSQYAPNCYAHPYGLTTLLSITPLSFPNGAHPYYGFSESEFVGLGLEEYISYDGAIADVAPAGPPNPMTVQAIKDLKAIVDTKTSSKIYFGNTLQTAPIFYTKSATVASGVAVFYLTTDGTSTGTAIFPNGPNMDSVNAFVSDATASYQMGYALTNSNKTLTVTANKLTTANILTGILGQATANGAVVRLQVWGN